MGMLTLKLQDTEYVIHHNNLRLDLTVNSLLVLRHEQICLSLSGLLMKMDALAKHLIDSLPQVMLKPVKFETSGKFVSRRTQMLGNTPVIIVSKSETTLSPLQMV